MCLTTPKWTPSILLQIPAAFETDISDPVDSEDTPDNGNTPGSGDTPNSGDTPTRDSGDQTTQPPTEAELSEAEGHLILWTLSDPVGNALALSQSASTTATDIHRTVFAHGPPGIYGELPKTWKTPGNKEMNKVSNAELGEYLIGIEANIKCSMDYWKEDKVSWTI